MTKITSFPKIVLFHGITGALVFLACFSNGSLDIVTHDSYYVISYSLIFFIYGILFLLFAVIILIIRRIGRRLSRILNWLHYSISLIGFVVMAVVAIVSGNPNRASKAYGDYSTLQESQEIIYSDFINELFTLVVLAFIIAQLLFLMNIVRAFVIRKIS